MSFPGRRRREPGIQHSWTIVELGPSSNIQIPDRRRCGVQNDWKSFFRTARYKVFEAGIGSREENANLS
jgi:hypothetical protein